MLDIVARIRSARKAVSCSRIATPVRQLLSRSNTVLYCIDDDRLAGK